MTKIKYLQGDLFAHVPSKLGPDVKYVYIPHICNDQQKWGSGFVIPLGKAFPRAKQNYLELERQDDPNLSPLRQGWTQQVRVDSGQPEIFVENMIAQTLGTERPINYISLVKCMIAVRNHIEGLALAGAEIHAPFFGSERAGGDWNFIEQLINDCWLVADIPVTIHYLPGMTPKNWSLPND